MADFSRLSTEGDGPDGHFAGKAVIVYNREAKTLARYESDSRGYSLLMTGTVGADLGGAFTIYLKARPSPMPARRSG